MLINLASNAFLMKAHNTLVTKPENKESQSWAFIFSCARYHDTFLKNSLEGMQYEELSRDVTKTLHCSVLEYHASFLFPLLEVRTICFKVSLFLTGCLIKQVLWRQQSLWL